MLFRSAAVRLLGVPPACKVVGNRCCTAQSSAGAARAAAQVLSAAPPKAASPQPDGSELQRLLAEAAAERSELRAQIAQMAAALKDLSSELEQHTASGRNLLERQPDGGRDLQVREKFRPVLEQVANQPNHVSQMDNQTLAELGAQGIHSAHKERLLREIMQVDGVNWEAAHTKLFEMDLYNERFYWLESMPYRFGISGATAFGLLGVLMVFNKPLAEYYGVNIAKVPLPDGVESTSEMTYNQVGAWTWEWMEPMIGTGCFVILCCQFFRAQAWKLNMRPYTEAMLRYRANRLAKRYPEYDTSIVRAWAKHMPIVGMTFFPKYRRDLGFRGPG